MRKKKMMSRGLRNNNPGNIRLSGVSYRGEIQPSKDKAFKQFESMAWGYRAVFVLLHTYRVRHGADTLEEMLKRYAPATENHTEDYISFVAARTDIAPGKEIDTLSAEEMIPLVAAMSRVENGIEAIEDEVAQGWELFVKFKP